MKRTIKSLAIGILSLAVLAPAAAIACGGGRRGHRAGKKHHGAHFNKLVKKLNLDASQLAQVNALEAQSKAEAQALKSQLRFARKNMRTLMKSGSPNESAVVAQLESLNKLRFKMKKLRVTTMLRFRALLTSSQQAQLAQLKQQKRAQWKAKRKAWRQKHKDKAGASQTL